jgi:large subunit ribosomal protein L22
MIEATVKRRHLGVAPRKVGFIANALKNKNAQVALNQLEYLNKAAAKDLFLLVKSGIAAAGQKNANIDDLFIKEIYVCEGPSLKRRFIKGRGQSQVFKKMSSHITLTVSDEVKPLKQKMIKKTKSKPNTAEAKNKGQE